MTPQTYAAIELLANKYMQRGISQNTAMDVARKNVLGESGVNAMQVQAAGQERYQRAVMETEQKRQARESELANWEARRNSENQDFWSKMAQKENVNIYPEQDEYSKRLNDYLSFRGISKRTFDVSPLYQEGFKSFIEGPSLKADKFKQKSEDPMKKKTSGVFSPK